MSDSLEALIQSLEERLFEYSTRQDREALSLLLAEEFVEFGASGAAWDRAEILSALPEQAFVQRRLRDFKLRRLAPEVVLATYVCEVPTAQGLQRSLRSSLWRKTQERWQMVFHQGTRIAAE